jgi:hypothetical protein
MGGSRASSVCAPAGIKLKQNQFATEFSMGLSRSLAVSGSRQSGKLP